MAPGMKELDSVEKLAREVSDNFIPLDIDYRLMRSELSREAWGVL